MTETWQELGSSLSLPGYSCISVPKHFQHDRARRASGGIALFARADISSHISHWRPLEECTHLWVRIRASIGLEHDLFLCLCYLPPQNSTYYNSVAEYPLDVITREAHTAATLGNVLLAGDFNARTGTAPDWTSFAELAELEQYIHDLPTTPVPTTPSPRQNKDTKINPQGRALLEACQECQLLLVNGRTEGDWEGELTCFNRNKGASAVDIFAADFSLLTTTVSKLHVQPHPPCMAGCSLSDHCPLTLTLRRRAAPTLPTPPQPSPAHIPRFAYRPGAATLGSYGDALARDPLLDPSHLNNLEAPAAADLLQQRILHHAAATHPAIDPSQTPSPTRHKHQPWFDEDCKAARRRLRAAVRRDPHSHAALQARQEFRRLTARRKKTWTEERLARLIEDACHSPAAFWRQFRKKGKASKLVSAARWFSYFQKLFSPPKARTAAPPPLPPLPPETASRWAAAAESLNAPITPGEVEACLDRLRKNKAAGYDGMRAEFILDAKPPPPPPGMTDAFPPGPNPLAAPIAIVFNKIFLSCFPTPWNTQIIHTIFKRGDESDPNDYRGISVGPVLAKLYAMVLETRISWWAETNGVRAASQAGFRQGYRTTDHIFVLQTLVDQARAKKSNLYCCFVDFKKAFDLVPRDLLWRRLEEAGIGGQMLAALKSLYANVRARVATPEGLTDAFEVSMGVKQGCPLSPLLFGLYIDRLEPFISACGGDPPTLNDTPVPMLLYADDLLLISSSPTGLQRQLDALQSFCLASELNVNLTKTQIVICGHPRARAVRRASATCAAPPASSHVWRLGGQTVSIVQEYKYLGLIFEGTHGFSRCAGRLADSGLKALHAMYARCRELRLEVPALMCKLFDSLVRPILSYGCEVWACLPGTAPAAMRERCEVQHRAFLRRCAGVAQATPSDIVYGEFGRTPLQVFWNELMSRYLQRLEKAAPDSLLASAFQASTALSRDGYPSWAGSARQQLAAATQPWEDDWRQRLSSNEAGALTRAYYALKPGWGQEPYLAASGIPHQHRLALARLRMGSHWLGSRLGIFARAKERQRERHTLCAQCSSPTPAADNPMLLCDQCDVGWHLQCLPAPHALQATPAGDWFCPSCTTAGGCAPIALNAQQSRIAAAEKCPFCGQFESEWHALFSCGLYNDIRESYLDLFSSLDNMSFTEFFTKNTDNLPRLGEFIYLCYRKRKRAFG